MSASIAGRRCGETTRPSLNLRWPRGGVVWKGKECRERAGAGAVKLSTMRLHPQAGGKIAKTRTCYSLIFS
eukprot:221763-Rhodomonas_salina.1